MFVRGDADGSGVRDNTDAIFLLNAIFMGGPQPPLRDAGDFNDDGALDVSDPIGLFSYLFDGGEAPPAPHMNPGYDYTWSTLSEPYCVLENRSCRQNELEAAVSAYIGTFVEVDTIINVDLNQDIWPDVFVRAGSFALAFNYLPETAGFTIAQDLSSIVGGATFIQKLVQDDLPTRYAVIYEDMVSVFDATGLGVGVPLETLYFPEDVTQVFWLPAGYLAFHPMSFATLQVDPFNDELIDFPVSFVPVSAYQVRGVPDVVVRITAADGSQVEYSGSQVTASGSALGSSYLDDVLPTCCVALNPPPLEFIMKGPPLYRVNYVGDLHFVHESWEVEANVGYPANPAVQPCSSTVDVGMAQTMTARNTLLVYSPGHSPLYIHLHALADEQHWDYKGAPGAPTEPCPWYAYAREDLPNQLGASVLVHMFDAPSIGDNILDPLGPPPPEVVYNELFFHGYLMFKQLCPGCGQVAHYWVMHEWRIKTTAVFERVYSTGDYSADAVFAGIGASSVHYREVDPDDGNILSDVQAIGCLPLDLDCSGDSARDWYNDLWNVAVDAAMGAGQ